MDIVSVTAAAASLALNFAKACKSLVEIKESYDQAPMTVTSMATECKTITAALTHLQGLTLEKSAALSPGPTLSDNLATGFDEALTGCMLILSVLEAELRKIIEGGEEFGNMTFRKRVKHLWNEETMCQLLQHLRGQHTAVSTLISILQA